MPGPGLEEGPPGAAIDTRVGAPIRLTCPGGANLEHDRNDDRGPEGLPGPRVRPWARCPCPALGPRDVLIKVKAASICGTDLHIHDWDKWAQSRIRPPLVFGHEFCGEVVELGLAVTRSRWAPSSRSRGTSSDGTCYQCRTGNAHICENVAIVGVDRPGCFAEFVAIPETNVYRDGRGLSPEVAAIQDPFGNAVHTTLSGEVAGLTVAVVGSGPIGCCAVAVARAAGARAVFATDIRPFRLDLARRMGADRMIDAHAARTWWRWSRPRRAARGRTWCWR